MFGWKDVLVDYECRKDEMARVSRARLLNQLLRQDRVPTEQPRRLLAKLGSYLVALGDHLQALQAVEAR